MKFYKHVGGLQSDWSLKRTRPYRSRRSAGLTLFEVLVTMFALTLLATFFLTATRAWLRGSDRAACISNIQVVQKGVRGYASRSGLQPGAIVSGLESKIVDSGEFFDELPECPTAGSYLLGGDQIPGVGTLYMTCSLAPIENHEPEEVVGW